MKQNFLLCLLAISNLLYSQQKHFFYEYRYVPDSTLKSNVLVELMILKKGDHVSDFYSFDKYLSDSTLLADSKKGIFSMPANRSFINERVIKYNNGKNLEYSTILSNTKYLVAQNVDLKWNLITEFDKVLGYRVQKATTEFGGRNWVAWFSTDIPLQDGPYKFSGLPGLILKVEDVAKNHTFELKGVKNTDENAGYPDLNNFRTVEVSYPQFVKVYTNYRADPISDLRGKYPDQTDSNGVFRTGAEIFRNAEKIALDNLLKDNNIIEINLIKQK